MPWECAVRRIQAIGVLAISVLSHSLVVATAAHDFWIEPSTFRPDSGSTVGLGLRVGQNVSGDSVARNERLIDRFTVVGKGGSEIEVRGIEGREPAGLFGAAEKGLYLAGYRSKSAPVDLPAAKFETYLREEGLESIIALREKRGERAKNGKERYSRCAKSLLIAGNDPNGPFDRELGLTLELIPRLNPYALGERALPIRLVFQSKPLAGVLVVAMSQEDPAQRLTARSNDHGLVSFRFPRRGVWLVKAVHMFPAPASSGADWESLWASLTFELPEKK
jgi:uncharacterized GH25 family protein